MKSNDPSKKEAALSGRFLFLSIPPRTILKDPNCFFLFHTHSLTGIGIHCVTPGFSHSGKSSTIHPSRWLYPAVITALWKPMFLYLLAFVMGSKNHLLLEDTV